MDVTRRSKLLYALLFAPLLIGLARCGPVQQPQQVSQLPAGFSQPSEVPWDPTHIIMHGEILRDEMQRPCDTQIQPMDNEVHDCQRLVRVGSSGRLEFGPLAGIFPNVEIIQQPEAIYSTPQVVARISNAGSRSGDNGYPELDIGAPTSPGRPAGFCLWLHNDTSRSGRGAGPGAGVGWRAGITPTEDPNVSNTLCTEAPDSGSWDLVVQRQTYPNTQELGYPYTARWQWSREDNFQYLGLTCGVAWCAIGPPGFEPEPIDQEEEDARRAIPGWYDAQFLAVPVLVAGGPVLIPGPWAAVYPLFLPDSLYSEPPNPVNSAWNTHQEVARVEVRPMNDVFTGGAEWVGPYDRKFNLDLSGYPTLSSTIEIRLPTGTDPNEAQYRNSAGTARRALGVGKGAVRHGPAKSARFRFQDEVDETIWIPCPDFGCCEVEEDGG